MLQRVQKRKDSALGKRNLNLDVVRIIAALMVLLVHTGQHVGGIWQDYTGFGANGVQIFFVLSAYLIMHSLERCDSVKTYFVHRAVRILPLYYLVLVLRYFYDLFWYLLVAKMSLPEIFVGPCGLQYLRYFFFLQVIVPTNDSALWGNRNALWTMSSFAFFYLIAPLLYRCIKSFWRSLVVFLVALAVTPYWISLLNKVLCIWLPETEASWFARSNPVSKIYIFLGGIVLYYAMKEKKQFLYAIMVCALLMSTSFQWHGFDFFSVVVVSLAVVLPGLEVPSGVAEKILLMSNASFALYLIHPMVLPSLRLLFLRIPINQMTQMFAYVLISLIISAVIYYKLAMPLENKAQKVWLN